LIAVCSDGAGSAAFSDVGSQTACARAVEVIADDIESGLDVTNISRERMLAWFGAVHERLSAKALELDISIRELACTLLLAVVGEKVAAFGQVGDGGIVVFGAEGYESVFWPEKAGEYLNLTHFVTEEHFEENVLSDVRPDIHEIALLTDGLQMVALDFAARKPHAPFFQPLFTALRGTASADDLVVPLRAFLDSDAVNSRTDDDKTLVLATRRGDVGP